MRAPVAIECKCALSSEAKYKLSIDINLPTPLLDPAFSESSFSFTTERLGSWSIVVRRDADLLAVAVRPVDLPSGSLGAVAASGVFRKSGPRYSYSIPLRGRTNYFRRYPDYISGNAAFNGNDDFSELDESSKAECLVATKYTVELDIKQETYVPVDDTLLCNPVDLAQRFAYLNTDPSLPNVRFLFPRQDGNAELWATKDLLVAASPYFASLFASDFAETASKRGKRPRSDVKRLFNADTNNAALDEDDSDVEVDEELFATNRPTLHGAASDDHAFHEIRITTFSYSTYRAVLLFIATGHIQFRSHLRSTPPPPADAKNDANGKSLAVKQKVFADLLTPKGAAAELCTPTAMAFDEVRKTALNYVVKNWSKVKTTDAWKEAKERVRNEGTPGASAVLVEVFEAIAEK
ncbi:uncharacterized protein JCM10292_001449 [Rhodotorula paludigena]|uniref:uncharacterized protein n=1 Tax=Rhodotorula paludigena TaxID=86838 RepID=UPI003181A94B